MNNISSHVIQKPDNSGNPGVLIKLDVFAAMLNVKPGMLIYALRTDGALNGLTLPASRRSYGRSSLMFDYADVMAFIGQFKGKYR